MALVDSRVVGMAMWHVNFSTWTGQSGIWLGDLFVSRSTGARASASRCCVGWPRSAQRGLDPAGVVGAGLERAVVGYRSLGGDAVDGSGPSSRVDGAALERLGSPAVG